MSAYQLEDLLEDCRNRVSALERQRAELEEQNTALLDELSKFKAENADLDEQNTKLLVRAERSDGFRETLRQDFHRLEEENAKLKAEATEREKQLAAFMDAYGRVRPDL